MLRRKSVEQNWAVASSRLRNIEAFDPKIQLQFDHAGQRIERHLVS
jgi:hypothetical protein